MDAEDLTSEAFYKILDSISKFNWKGEGSLEGWVFTICKNIFRNFKRKKNSFTPFSRITGCESLSSSEFGLLNNEISNYQNSDPLIKTVMEEIDSLKLPKK